MGIDTLVCFGWRGRPENRGVKIDFKPNFGHRLARSGVAAAARAIFVEVVSRGAPQMTEKIPAMIDLRCHFQENFEPFSKIHVLFLIIWPIWVIDWWRPPPRRTQPLENMFL